jgi:hypothetical protein
MRSCMRRKALVQFWSEEIRLNTFLYSLTVFAVLYNFTGDSEGRIHFVSCRAGTLRNPRR